MAKPKMVQVRLDTGPLFPSLHVIADGDAYVITRDDSEVPVAALDEVRAAAAAVGVPLTVRVDGPVTAG